MLLADINVAALDRALGIIKQKVDGASVAAVKVDVSKEDEVKVAVEKAVTDFGRLDIMVCAPPLRQPNTARLLWCSLYAPCSLTTRA